MSLRDLLTRHGLSEYIDAFERADLSTDALSGLSDDTLVHRFGMASEAARGRFRALVASLAPPADAHTEADDDLLLDEPDTDPGGAFSPISAAPPVRPAPEPSVGRSNTARLLASLLAAAAVLAGAILWWWMAPITADDVARWREERDVARLMEVAQTSDDDAFRGYPGAIRAAAITAVVELSEADLANVRVLLSGDAATVDTVVEHLSAAQVQALGATLVPLLRERRERGGARVRDLLSDDVRAAAFDEDLAVASRAVEANEPDAVERLDAACWWTGDDSASADRCDSWRNYAAVRRARAAIQARSASDAQAAMSALDVDVWTYGAGPYLRVLIDLTKDSGDRSQVEADLRDTELALEVVRTSRSKVLRVTVWVHGEAGEPNLYEVSETSGYGGPGRERHLLRTTTHSFTTTGTATLWLVLTGETRTVTTVSGNTESWNIFEEFPEGERLAAHEASLLNDIGRLRQQLQSWDAAQFQRKVAAEGAWHGLDEATGLALLDARRVLRADPLYPATSDVSATPIDAATARSRLDAMALTGVPGEQVRNPCLPLARTDAVVEPFLRRLATDGAIYLVGIDGRTIQLEAFGPASAEGWPTLRGAWQEHPVTLTIGPPGALPAGTEGPTGADPAPEAVGSTTGEADAPGDTPDGTTGEEADPADADATVEAPSLPMGGPVFAPADLTVRFDAAPDQVRTVPVLVGPGC